MSEFQAPTAVNMTGTVGTVSFGDDSRLNVRFYKGKEIHGLQSQEQGRPIYVGVDMCAIRQPGERDEAHCLATIDKQMRFPRQWEAYQAGQEYVPDGTPLDVIFPQEPDTVANLRFFKIHTVEQLAALQANAIARIGMGGINLVNRAQRFMEAASGYQNASRMGRELEEQKSKNEELTTRLAALEKLLETATEPARGSPKAAKNSEGKTEQ